jgi:hypothetical protein
MIVFWRIQRKAVRDFRIAGTSTSIDKEIQRSEADGANEVSANSEEGTKIQQLIGRTLSYDLDAFIVMECTVTTDERS